MDKYIWIHGYMKPMKVMLGGQAEPMRTDERADGTNAPNETNAGRAGGTNAVRAGESSPAQ